MSSDQKEITAEDVEKLAKLWCSYEEIADWFGVDVKVIKDGYTTLIEKSRTDTKQAIRRAQIKAALEGNTQMLTLLGKNILGQNDEVEKPVDVSAATMEQLSREELLERIRALALTHNEDE